MKRTRRKKTALALQFDDYSDNLLESSRLQSVSKLSVYGYAYAMAMAMAMPMSMMSTTTPTPTAMS